MGQSFKYAKYHENFNDCPPDAYREGSCEAFRFVFDGLDPERSFLPMLILQERGLIAEPRIKEQCNGYGLSFFVSEESAQAKFLKLRKSNPQAHKRLGNAIAQVQITKEHGVVCEPKKGDGHFTLHEFSGADWACK